MGGLTTDLLASFAAIQVLSASLELLRRSNGGHEAQHYARFHFWNK